MKKGNPDPKNYEMIVVSISRTEIDSFDHITILNTLHSCKENAKKFESRLNFLITGYDNDERELHEIEEVRIYFDFLDRCFPYWFYFLIKTLPPEYSPINMLVALLVPINIICKDSGMQKIDIDMSKFREFMNIHFHFLNELTDELKLSESENIRISNEVAANISLISF